MNFDYFVTTTNSILDRCCQHHFDHFEQQSLDTQKRTMSPPFGSFSPFCSSPSTLSDQEDVSISTAGPLPQCNLFFRALLKITEPPALTTLFPFSDVTGTPNDRQLGYITSDTNVEDLVAARAVNRAGLGIGIRCDPERMGVEGSLGDIGKLRTNFYLLGLTDRSFYDHQPS